MGETKESVPCSGSRREEKKQSVLPTMKTGLKALDDFLLSQLYKSARDYSIPTVNERFLDPLETLRPTRGDED